ncbi:DMT family transporter [Actibacterium sp. 188UL27-1]|uniref:DMT family transporter n=1 Tax=Actibacterium sp. 188UL27-1 TaxID=2786961 RepID=UPI00195C5509|nr:DMT family transporter [Actibacterium sp. 188UL27-1]MBM7066479.1 DMT family transporter [Actibacterium sp. 188UL27-1]
MDISPNPRVAVLLMLTASALIAATTLLAKALGTDALGPALHPLQVSHGRFIFALLALAAAASILRPKLQRPHWRLHLARTTCGWIGVTLMFAASARIALSDATAISFLNPVFAMILAIPLLGERVGPVRWLAAAIALCGAMVLLRPGPGTFQPAALIALASAAVIGFEIILIKRLSGLENPFQVLLVNNSLGVIIATCAVIAFWEPPTPAQWAGLAALGTCMACAQACFVNAMARAEASFVVPFSYAALIFAGLYDAALFGVIPDWVSLSGAGIILSGAALLAWREAAAARRSNQNQPPVRNS